MTRPIRVLHVLGRLDRGGAETMIMNLYRHIDRSKVQFDFVIHTDNVCDYNEEVYALGGRIFSVPRYTGKNHLAYVKAWKNLFKTHTEHKIIHGHMRSTATIYLGIAKKVGLITVAHSHSIASRGNKIEQLVKNSLQYPIRFIADYLFACSEAAGKWLFGKNIVEKDNYRIIKNAIDIKKFKFNQVMRNKIRKQYQIENKFVLGHVGSFTPPKNHVFLLNVFAQIKTVKRETVLFLIGDGEQKNQIVQTAKRLHISNSVFFLGNKENVYDYLQAMDVFLFPSLFEGLGLAVIEAQAAGLPCIISDKVPDDVIITELVNRIPITDPSEWVDFVLKSELDRKNCIKDIIQNGYSIETQVKKIKRLYIEMYDTI